MAVCSSMMMPRVKTKQVIFSVKAGHTNVADVRDLRGVLDRENARDRCLDINAATRPVPMEVEAAGAGFYDSPAWGKEMPKTANFNNSRIAIW